MRGRQPWQGIRTWPAYSPPSHNTYILRARCNAARATSSSHSVTHGSPHTPHSTRVMSGAGRLPSMRARAQACRGGTPPVTSSHRNGGGVEAGCGAGRGAPPHTREGRRVGRRAPGRRQPASATRPRGLRRRGSRRRPATRAPPRARSGRSIRPPTYHCGVGAHTVWWGGWATRRAAGRRGPPRRCRISTSTTPSAGARRRTR